MSASRILFCDYDGEFQFADELSRVGFAIDQIRPDGLRHVAVGDHQIFLFSFEAAENLSKVLKTCEKLKYAELSTPLVLLARANFGPEFLNHQKNKFAANAYVSNPLSVSAVLDVLDNIVDCPLPPHLKSQRFFASNDELAEQVVEGLKTQIADLQTQLAQFSKKREEEGTEGSWRPKLKALLEGQKLQFQTESERLSVQLSEVEAKLLDREMKIKDMDLLQEKLKKKLEEIIGQHEKAQQTLRDFYMIKLKTLETEKCELEEKLAAQK